MLTKKQFSIVKRHQSSNLYYLYQCYDRPSWYKQCAYDNCKAKCSKLNGYDFKIIGYNSQMFSIGFYYVKDGKKTFHYETNRTSLDFIVE